MENERRPINDKVALILAGITLSTAVGLAAVKWSEAKTQPDSSSEPNATLTATPNVNEAGASPNNPEVINNSTMVLSDNEESFFEQMLGYMSWTPDGPITYWTTVEGKRRYLLTGGQDNGTYFIETDGGQSLKDIMKSGQINRDSFKEVIGPDREDSTSWRKDYVGITGVIQDKNNPDHLYGIAHGERRTSRNASADYTATIGLLESSDGGMNWQDKGVLITGTDVKEPGGGRVSGAGQPTVIAKDGYAYIMYIDWSATGQHPDQLYMAKMKVNDDFSLGQVEYLTDNGFSAERQNLKPIIPVPLNNNLVYMALPHMSFNTKLNKFIAEGESDTGFWHSESSDLLNWSTPEIVYDFTDRGGKPHGILKIGQKWDSYPTALSENQPNSQITDGSGIFYHSSGDNLSPHEPATLEFTFK